MPKRQAENVEEDQASRLSRLSNLAPAATNFAALIALFTLIFLLQHFFAGPKSVDQPEQHAKQLVVPVLPPPASVPAADAVQSAAVAMEPQPPPQAAAPRIEALKPIITPPTAIPKAAVAESDGSDSSKDAETTSFAARSPRSKPPARDPVRMDATSERQRPAGIATSFEAEADELDGEKARQDYLAANKSINGIPANPLRPKVRQPAPEKITSQEYFIPFERKP